MRGFLGAREYHTVVLQDQGHKTHATIVPSARGSALLVRATYLRSMYGLYLRLKGDRKRKNLKN